MKRSLRGTTALIAAGAAACVLAACGSGSGGNPLAAKTAAPVAGTVTVGGFNFPESTLLADIYAKALKAKGVKVTTKLNIGSREIVYSQIKSGGLTVLPEYNGALLSYLDAANTASTTAQVNAALTGKLPASLEILNSSTAEDKDALVVTAATAAKDKLTTISDLAPVAKTLTIGGPPEFKTRAQGIIGLKSLYGLTFKSFRSLDTAGPLTIAALKQGDIQVADIFTTDPSIVQDNFVALTDPKNVFGAQNVTPLVNKAGITPAAVAELNVVSAKLDTTTLASLVKKVVADKDDPDTVAASWLSSVGLV